jgi:HK97 family phage major capsid protein
MKVKKSKIAKDITLEFKPTDSKLLSLPEAKAETIYKQFNVVVEAVDDKKLRCIVNSGKEDRHGEVLDIRGLDIKKYMENPVLAYSHDYQKMSVGRTEKLTKTHDGQLISEFVFATDVDGYDLPKILDQLYRKKYQFAFSIGFIPFEMKGNIYTKSEMIEFSPVLIGADANALLKTLSTKPEKQVTKKIKSLKTKKMKVKLSQKIKAFEALMAEQKTAYEQKLNDLASKLDTVVAKDVNDNNGGEPVEVTKEEKLKSWVKGMMTKDFSEYNQILKSANNTTDASPLLPPTEFVAEVLRMEEQYGVARKYATLRRTDRTSITLIKGSTDVAIYETSEAGRIKSTKTGYDTWVMTFKKFAAIAPLTEELLEDSAIDIWNDLTSRFARAYAKQEDELVFNHATAGIVNLAGAAEVVITGDSIEDIDFDDVNKSLYAVPTDSMKNGRFYFHRSIMGVLQRLKDPQGRYILVPGPNGPATGTLWGMPYELTEVLPALTDDAEDTTFIVFGDLKNTVLAERTQMSAKIFDTGNVDDPDDAEDTDDELNLLTQDLMAMRVIKRFNAKTVFEEAYALIKTGVSAS